VKVEIGIATPRGLLVRVVAKHPTTT